MKLRSTTKIWNDTRDLIREIHAVTGQDHIAIIHEGVYIIYRRLVKQGKITPKEKGQGGAGEEI